MRVINSPRPKPRQVFAQRLRLANAYFGIAHHLFYEQVNARERFLILNLPVHIVFPRRVGPDQLTPHRPIPWF
jgi:hypothetical protein